MSYATFFLVIFLMNKITFKLKETWKVEKNHRIKTKPNMNKNG